VKSGSGGATDFRKICRETGRLKNLSRNGRSITADAFEAKSENAKFRDRFSENLSRHRCLISHAQVPRTGAVNAQCPELAARLGFAEFSASAIPTAN